jgi:hypothetical protein
MAQVRPPTRVPLGVVSSDSALFVCSLQTYSETRFLGALQKGLARCRTLLVRRTRAAAAFF